MKAESKRANSFKLFWLAVKGSGPDIWVSLQVIIAITLVFAVIFYFSEHRAQPEEYGFWQSILWAFSRYIGDPGKFAQVAPVTIGGRLIAMCIGILGILIFAIPAGVIGARFRKAIDDDKRQRELDNYKEKIIETFRPSQHIHTKFRVPVRFRSLVWLKSRLLINETDIIATVEHSENMRLRNLAGTYSVTENPNDRLVVECFSLEGRTSYGCCINNHSPITIVSTSSFSEAGSGAFAYLLARMGGFNYISKEFDPNPEHTTSFYTIDDVVWKQVKNGNNDDEGEADAQPNPACDFISHLRELADGEDHWVIFILGTTRMSNINFHFRHRLVEKDQATLGMQTSVIPQNEEKFMAMYQDASRMLADNDYPFSGDMEYYTPLKAGLDDVFPTMGGKKNVAVRLMQDGCKFNAFTLTIRQQISARDTRWVSVVYRLTQIIAEHLAGTKIEAQLSWKRPGFGHGEIKPYK